MCVCVWAILCKFQLKDLPELFRFNYLMTFNAQIHVILSLFLQVWPAPVSRKAHGFITITERRGYGGRMAATAHIWESQSEGVLGEKQQTAKAVMWAASVLKGGRACGCSSGDIPGLWWLGSEHCLYMLGNLQNQTWEGFTKHKISGASHFNEIEKIKFFLPISRWRSKFFSQIYFFLLLHKSMTIWT